MKPSQLTGRVLLEVFTQEQEKGQGSWGLSWISSTKVSRLDNATETERPPAEMSQLE